MTHIRRGDDFKTSWPQRWPSERRFYFGMTVALAAAVLLGYSRSFFLRHWFPQWAGAHAPQEPYFYYFHGMLFAAWFLLLMVQASLVSAGRVDLHRRLGWFGAALAAAMVPAGLAAAMIAARRPTGFVDVPLPPLEFLPTPLTDIMLFGAFVLLAVTQRCDPQCHKRYLLFASFSLVGAAIARWPFDIMAVELPGRYYDMSDVFIYLFLAALVVWDLYSRRRLHPVTLKGGLVLIAVPPFVHLIGASSAWLEFAGRVIGVPAH